MTTSDPIPTLEDAIAQLDAATGDDPRAAAVLAWARTHDRALLKTLAVVYRNHADERLRLVARAANALVDRDTHTPFYDDGPLQLNLAAGTYRIGDRVKALDYLTRAVQAKPDWQTNPIIIDFAAALMDVPPELAAMLIRAPGGQSAFNVAKGAGWWQEHALAARHIDRRSLTRSLAIFGVGMALLIALTIHIVASSWLPQARLVRGGAYTELIASLVPVARWAFANQWPLSLLLGLIAALDLLVRGAALHLAAVLVIEGRERRFIALFYRLMLWQMGLAVLSLGALCAIFVVSAMSLSGIRNANVAALELAQTFALLRIWLIASAVAYAVFVGRLLMETYRIDLLRAAFALIGASVVVTLVEGLLTSGILSLIRR